MQIVVIHIGEQRKVMAMCRAKEAPIYQEELFPHIDEQLKHKINLHIKFLSDRRFPVENTTIAEKLKGYGNLYELKPKPARLFFFMVGDDAIITSGYIKKKNKTDIQEIRKAIGLRDNCLQEREE